MIASNAQEIAAEDTVALAGNQMTGQTASPQRNAPTGTKLLSARP